MRRRIILLIALISSLISYHQVSAQFDQTGYSIIGLGNVNWGGLAHNASMGGLGITTNSKFLGSSINPAVGALNEESVFQMGGSLDIRTFSNNQSRYNSTAGGFKDFSMNLPIVFSKWNMGLSLTPYTAVNYGFTIVEPNGGPGGIQATTEVQGRGGLDEVAMTHSFRVKNLLLGIKASFLFGTIQKEDRFFLGNLLDNGFGITVVNDRRSYHNLSATAGFVYKIKVAEDSWINVGGFFSPEFSVRQNTLRTFENQDPTGNILNTNTLIEDDTLKKTVSIPNRLGFGISYEKLQKFTIGADFQVQNWADYRDKDGLVEPSYGRAFKAAFGGRYTPNPQASKVFGAASYRFGVHFEQTPFLLNNETIDDIGINFGASLPLNAFWGLSHLNIGATFGRRGNVSNGLVRENYIKLHFGFSLQDVTWFTRQRFN